MKLEGKTAVITGGAGGIGLALAQRFIAEGAIVLISDVDEKALALQATALQVIGIRCDVGKEQDVKELVEQATEALGHIDIFVANAGVARFGDVFSQEAQWDFTWHVNVMSQVYAAKYVLPQMIARKSGYILNTASAAGLLMEFHSVLYTTSKHASIGFSEWLAATYRQDGISVSVLCPGPVKTAMAANVAAMQEDALEPAEVAAMVVAALHKEQFMIATHEKIWQLYQVKSADYDKYIELMVQRRAYKLSLDHQS